jgi:hypothetical protein
MGEAGAATPAIETTARDEQQASARCQIAPAWLPHLCRSSSAGLSTPVHTTEQAADAVAEPLRDAERSLA